MTSTPFIISISDLARPGDSRSEHVVASVDWRVAMSRLLPDPPLEAELKLQAISGGILVRGTVDATVRHTCDRCLDEFDAVEHLEVSAVYLEDQEEDGYVLAGDELDLEQMIRDEVMLGLPIVTRCSIDCPGVVTTPGTGLNTALPGAAEAESASPFDVLRDLLETDT